ncbi:MULTISPECIES: iron-siderophore ABC transporter substrate-binding protein [unclassified Leucobacter]|uniref:iron-siderophore ABC transporter substrate-binding protein n=1 Tax=unclassified Leucobacter TaxID=2621730 RepID=UPI00165E7C92|nr:MULTISPECIES: iron-siderophore ABC transporter substrate-binding protein [unclassified Leucobacter]MBC9928271.1 iron-siderophore ABC transporter substrate-binding protein [Leucobacter sp. cx-169]
MRVSRLLTLAGVALLAIPLAACSSGGGGSVGDAASETASGEFPVTIEHAFGTTIVPERPERVATVAWANHEVPLALGVVPVGMSKATWGDDDGDGVLPWVEDQLDELGAQTPVLFDETDGIDFEAVAATDPDVILAAYSGLTEEEYATLSKIAPVVAYPEVAWGTTVQQMIELNAAALGLADEGDELIGSLDGAVQTALAAHPKMQDTKFLFSYIDPANLSQIGFYTSHDTRPGFLADLGLPLPDAVVAESQQTDAFYAEISAEQADRLADVDVLVTYGDPEGNLVEQLQADPLMSQIPAVAAGRVVVLAESTPLAASANPSPLSIQWGIDRYFDALAAAI